MANTHNITHHDEMDKHRRIRAQLLLQQVVRKLALNACSGRWLGVCAEGGAKVRRWVLQAAVFVKVTAVKFS